jgi:hypothetical protein
LGCCPTDGRDPRRWSEGFGRPSLSIEIDAFEIVILFFRFVAEAVRSCGNPGRRMVAGISNGCGKVQRWTGGGPELSMPGQLPQPGRGAASPAAEAASWTRPGRIQVCVRTYVAASRLACKPACGFAWPILRPPPSSSPFGFAPSRSRILRERNETLVASSERRSSRSVCATT